jgi:hypothetical protein
MLSFPLYFDFSDNFSQATQSYTNFQLFKKGAFLKLLKKFPFELFKLKGMALKE